METFTKENINSSKAGILNYGEGSDSLLISFGGVQQGIGIPIFEFFNSLSNIPCDKVFIRDFNQAWYQLGVDETIKSIDDIYNYLKNLIEEKKYSKVVIIGNSMGGYAAMLFGSMLNADTVLAFSPQTFIDKFHRFIYMDNRWSKELKKVFANPLKQSQYFDLKKYFKNIDTKCAIHLYYSSPHKLDSIHAKRLKNIKYVELHGYNEEGHGIIKTLRDNGELLKIIGETFSK